MSQGDAVRWGFTSTSGHQRGSHFLFSLPGCYVDLDIAPSPADGARQYYCLPTRSWHDALIRTIHYRLPSSRHARPAADFLSPDGAKR